MFQLLCVFISFHQLLWQFLSCDLSSWQSHDKNCQYLLPDPIQKIMSQLKWDLKDERRWWKIMKENDGKIWRVNKSQRRSTERKNREGKSQRRKSTTAHSIRWQRPLCYFISFHCGILFHFIALIFYQLVS